MLHNDLAAIRHPGAPPRKGHRLAPMMELLDRNFITRYIVL